MKHILAACVAILSFVSAPPIVAKTLNIALLMAEKSRQKEANEILNAATSAFFESKRFKVIERDQLPKIFQERDLTDFITGAPGDLSNLEGVDLIGVVTYSKEEGVSMDKAKRQVEIYIDVRLTDVKTGQVIGSVNSRRPSVLYEPTTPFNASRLLLADVRELFPPEGSVLNVDGETVVVNLGTIEGVKKGDTLEVIQDGEVFFDAEGKSYPPLEELVGILKVTQVSTQLSKCKIKKGAEVISLGARVRLKGTDRRLLNWAQRVMPFLKKKAN